MLFRSRCFVRNTFAVQKCSRDLGFECKVHILRNVPREPGDPDRVEFSRNNSDEVTACVKQRSAAVAALHGRADLKIARVVAKPGESAHVSNREIGGRGQNPRERIPQRCYRITSANRAPIQESGHRGDRGFASNDGKIVFLIACD